MTVSEVTVSEDGSSPEEPPPPVPIWEAWSRAQPDVHVVWEEAGPVGRSPEAPLPAVGYPDLVN